MTDVDEGSTVTDFLPAERDRGVTIQSAAISFHWPPRESDRAPKAIKTAELAPHNINLIDTPGHADFTFEVLRSLRILDGAICILDGVAGVEAQTEKVWYQAAKYQIPKIVYVNKLDREGAAFSESVRQIASKLHAHPAVCQIPWWKGRERKFCGIGDPITLHAIQWPDADNGTNFEIFSMDQLAESNADFHSEILRARKALVELLIENEECLLDEYVNLNEDPLAIPSESILRSLRKSIVDLKQNIVPVFAGASFVNKGVQTLLDAVVQLLPSPTEVPDPEITLGGSEGKLSELLQGVFRFTNPDADSSKKSMSEVKKPNMALIKNLEACALAFKVVHDARRGALVYIRVYSGSVKKQDRLFNTTLHLTESAPQLLKMYASESVNVDSIPAGQIGVIPGLKHTRTGDTLISYKGANPKTGPPAPLNSLQLRPIEVPPSMFSSSIEPQSLSDQKVTQAALEILTREDPSLQVIEDEESGQTLLGGMGEFHLEVAQDRLLNHLKTKTTMGKIEIAFREAILQPSSPQTSESNQEKTGKPGRASCIAQVKPVEEGVSDDEVHGISYRFTCMEDGNRVTIGFEHTPNESPDSEPTLNSLPTHLDVPTIHSALKNGAMSALGRGINYNLRLRNTHVIIKINPKSDISGSETTTSALSSAARLATTAALKQTVLDHGSALLEPIMDVAISADEAYIGAIVNDLSSTRGGQVQALNEGSDAGSIVESTQNANHTALRIDVSKVYVPPDPFETADQGRAANNETRQTIISARVPLREMIGYLKQLRSTTGGRGSFVMTPYRFEKVVGQREKIITRELTSI